MRVLKLCRLLSLLLIAVLLAGCAADGTVKRWGQCAMIGGGTGLLLGAIESSSAAAGGAAIGALLGGLLCRNSDKDSDHDGVKDSVDRCPNTAKGVAVDETGCPLDSDGDGVPNHLDRCPNTAPYAAVDSFGCPDSDSDGIPDNLDQCPGTSQGSKVNDVGCLIFIRENVSQFLFNFNSTELSKADKAVLDQIASKLIADNALVLQVYGYTDDTGNPAYNDALSLRRAESVTHYLLGKGVPAKNLQAIGAGIITENNKTAEGRHHNRKADLFLDLLIVD